MTGAIITGQIVALAWTLAVDCVEPKVVDPGLARSAVRGAETYVSPGHRTANEGRDRGTLPFLQTLFVLRSVSTANLLQNFLLYEVHP